MTGLGVAGDGADAAARMRALPAKEVLKPSGGLEAADAPRPMIDGELIRERTDDAFARGHQLKVPYIVGGNSFESSLFARQVLAAPELQLASVKGATREQVVQAFGDGAAQVAAFNVMTATLITEPDRALARLDAKAGVPVYRYFFAYVQEAQRGPTMPGAGHGSELSYVFDTLPRTPIPYNGRTLPAASPADLAVSRAMHAYWVAFAKTGRPGAAGGVDLLAGAQVVDHVTFDIAAGAMDDAVARTNGADGRVTVQHDLQKARLDLVAASAAASGH